MLVFKPRNHEARYALRPDNNDKWSLNRIIRCSRKIKNCVLRCYEHRIKPLLTHILLETFYSVLSVFIHDVLLPYIDFHIV